MTALWVVLLCLAVAGPVAAVLTLWWAARNAPAACEWHETVPVRWSKGEAKP